MEDNVLFFLGDDITKENVLAVLAALQAYVSAAKAKNRAIETRTKIKKELNLKLYLVCAEREYDFIWQRCLSNLEGIYAKWDAVPFRDYTYVTTLSIARALSVGTGEKHLAILLGILIGAESSSLPDVSNLLAEYKNESRNWYITSESLIKIFENTTDKYNCFSNDKGKYSLEQVTRFVFSSCAVLGVSSYETYLGCALGKPVVEIQTNKQLAKWSNKKYVQIQDSTNIDAIQKGISKCLQDI